MKALTGVLLAGLLLLAVMMPAMAEDTNNENKTALESKKFEEKRKEIREKLREKKEKWREFRERIREAREHFMKIKRERYEERKKIYEMIRERGLNDTEVFNAAKDFLVSGIDLAISHIEVYEKRVVNLNLSDEREQRLIEEAEALKAALEDWRTAINESRTPQELRENHRAFVEDWKLIKVKIHALVGLAMAYKLERVADTAQKRVSLIHGKLDTLEERGADVSKAREMLSECSKTVIDAKRKIDTAISKFETVLNTSNADDAKELIHEGKDTLKDGIKDLRHSFVELKSTFKEAIKSARGLAKEHRKEMRVTNEGNVSAIRGMTEQ